MINFPKTIQREHCSLSSYQKWHDISLVAIIGIDTPNECAIYLHTWEDGEKEYYVIGRKDVDDNVPLPWDDAVSLAMYGEC